MCVCVCTFGIPSTQDDPTIGRIFLDFSDALAKLVDTLTCIVRVTVVVFRSKVAPLEAIDWAQITFSTMSKAPAFEKGFWPITIPNFDPLLREYFRISEPMNKPQKLFYNPPQKGAFRGEQGQSRVPKGEAEIWRSKYGDGPSACPVWASITRVKNPPYKS